MATRPAAHLKKKVKRPELAPIEHAVLKRKRVSPPKLKGYIEALQAAVAPYMLPEAFHALRINMASGDNKAAELVLKSFDIIHSSGVNVTQTNTNSASSELVGGHKTFDAYMRDRAVEKRVVVDVTPEKIEEANECSSSQQLHAGKEIPELPS